MELINPEVGKRLLMKVLNACRGVPGKESELEKVEKLIEEIRSTDDNETPWPIPTMTLLRLISQLSTIEETIDEETKALVAAITCKKRRRNCEKMFLEHINPDRAGRCANNLCRKVEKLKKCSKCRVFTYCSLACQKTDWKRHKTTCREIYEIRHWDEVIGMKIE